MSDADPWAIATAALGAVALVLDWLRARADLGRVWATIDDHEQRLRALERMRE